MIEFDLRTDKNSQSTENSQRLSRRIMAASILTASAINLYGGVHVLARQTTECVTEDSSNGIVASATYDPTNARTNFATGEMPAGYENTFAHFIPRVINDPIVQLALQKKDVTTIVARTIEPQGNPLLSRGPVESGRYDKDARCGTAKEISLDFSTAKSGHPEKNLFADEYYTHITVVHEAIHGLNDKWWMDIGRTLAFDRTIEPKIYQLQNACDDVNKWITYKNNDTLPKSMDYPDDTTVSAVCSTELMTMNTEAMQDAFRCINEGAMLQDTRKLKYPVNLGHPWSNATELASSATDVLYFNPSYLERCFSSQDMMEATLLKRYVKAALELSFAHRPELEQILRQSPKTADAIDFLMATV